MNYKIIDIIILSFAKDEYLKNLTQQAIDSLLISEQSNIKFNVLVIESNKRLSPFQYTGTSTIYPKQKFGYNKFMNIGIKITTSDYVCLCNNDLIFHKSWATEILKAFEKDMDLYSASPICEMHHTSIGIKANSGNIYGYEIRKEVSGWCIFFKRAMLHLVSPFEEKLKFWYSDRDYINTLKSNDIKHALVTASIVDHLESRTLELETPTNKDLLTRGDFFYYDYKWNHRNIFTYNYRMVIYKIKIIKNYLVSLKQLITRKKNV